MRPSLSRCQQVAEGRRWRGYENAELVSSKQLTCFSDFRFAHHRHASLLIITDIHCPHLITRVSQHSFCTSTTTLLISSSTPTSTFPPKSSHSPLPATNHRMGTGTERSSVTSVPAHRKGKITSSSPKASSLPPACTSPPMSRPYPDSTSNLSLRAHRPGSTRPHTNPGPSWPGRTSWS